MNLSIVIPLLNEEESLQELHNWIVSVMKNNNYSYEIIFIDDGSTDNSWSIIEQLSNENQNVKGIRFLKISENLKPYMGFDRAQGDVIITMDADLQDNPNEIPELYELITSQNFDLVSRFGKETIRFCFCQKYSFKLFNWAARKTSGVQLNDFNCGLKAYKNVVVKNIEVSGEMHRYIPVLAKMLDLEKLEKK